MFRRLVPPALLAVALAWLAGCGPAKLNESRTWEMEAGDARAIDLPGQPKPQTLNVDFSSSEGDVTVYVFKEDDLKGKEALNEVEAHAKKALKQAKSKGESFTVDVPENTPARVVVSAAGKKTTVNLKVTNQK